MKKNMHQFNTCTYKKTKCNWHNHIHIHVEYFIGQDLVNERYRAYIGL